MAIVAMTAQKEEPDPKVYRARCCTRQPGLTANIGGHWFLLKDAPADAGKLASIAIGIRNGHPGLKVCRGCFNMLDEFTPTQEWTWGLDTQVDDHLRQIGRELAEEAKQ